MSDTVMSWPVLVNHDFQEPSVADLGVPEIVMAVQEAVENHILGSGPILERLKSTAKGPGTSCPDSPIKEIHDYVARQRAPIDKSDPRVTLAFLKQFVWPVAQLERKTMSSLLLAHDDLTPDETILVSISPTLSILLDKLWAAWFTRVCVPFQSQPKERKADLKKLLSSQLPVYDYTVFDMKSDTIVSRQAWASAFPDQISAICKLIKSLNFESSELNRYFEALRLAYHSKEINSLEKLWSNVDVAWCQLGTDIRFLPVHGIESRYEHPRCVSPEFRLNVRTDIFTDEIKWYRTTEQDWAKRFLKDQPEVLQAYLTKSGKIDAGVFVEAFRSGVCLNFRFAGQNLPNRSEVALEHGGRVFMDPSSGRMRSPEYMEIIHKLCVPEVAKVLAPLCTPESFLHSTLRHEFGHPVARTTESDEALGDALPLLEEAKSTEVGTCAALPARQDKNWALTSLAQAIARIGRFSMKPIMENETSAAYVRDCQAIATILEICGIIEMTDDGLQVHLNSFNPNALVQKAEVFVAKVVRAYVEHSPDSIKNLTQEYCNTEPGSLMARVIERVNRP
ncbi:MAG: hypothetical protein V1853_00985 [bacterium]